MVFGKVEGFGVEHNLWEPQENIHTPDLVAEFHQRHPGAARHIRMTDFLSLTFQPTTVLRRHISEGGVDVKGHPIWTPNSVHPPLYVPPHHHPPPAKTG